VIANNLGICLLFISAPPHLSTECSDLPGTVQEIQQLKLGSSTGFENIKDKGRKAIFKDNSQDIKGKIMSYFHLFVFLLDAMLYPRQVVKENAIRTSKAGITYYRLICHHPCFYSIQTPPPTAHR
jgi:hypothetical protein